MKTKPFSSNSLKLIAIIAMTIDHIAWAIWPGFSTNALAIASHMIGRLTCPIMCFFIAEGYYYTHSKKKYALRLSVLAIVSHFCYVLASNDYVDYHSFIPFYYGSFFNQTSVIWSLLGGLVLLMVNDLKIKWGYKLGLTLTVCLICFPSDWSCIASLCILHMGTSRGNFKKQMEGLVFYVFLYALVYFFALDKLYGLIQLSVILSIGLLYLYNGKRGKNRQVNTFFKVFFYAYYPIHLLVIGLLAR